MLQFSSKRTRVQAGFPQFAMEAFQERLLLGGLRVVGSGLFVVLRGRGLRTCVVLRWQKRLRKVLRRLNHLRPGERIDRLGPLPGLTCG